MTAPRGYFPGSKTPLPEFDPVPPAPETDPWAPYAITKLIAGDPVEFYTIGVLCAGFDRPPVTIRRWIREGLIPGARFRTPTKNGIVGKRLYTRDQVQTLLGMAATEGILGSRYIDWDKHRGFSAQVKTAWDNLSDGQ